MVREYYFMMRIFIPIEGVTTSEKLTLDKQSKLLSRVVRINNDVIAEAVPAGFSIVPATSNRPWPKDEQGYTYVPIKCDNEATALDHWINRAKELEKELKAANSSVANVLSVYTKVASGETQGSGGSFYGDGKGTLNHVHIPVELLEELARQHGVEVLGRERKDRV